MILSRDYFNGTQPTPWTPRMKTLLFDAVSMAPRDELYVTKIRLHDEDDEPQTHPHLRSTTCCGVVEITYLQYRDNLVEFLKEVCNFAHVFYSPGRILYYSPIVGRTTNTAAYETEFLKLGFKKSTESFFNPNSGNRVVYFYLDISQPNA